MKGCIHSSKASILVNGNPRKNFSISKGVRQGDVLCLFLFITVMEGLIMVMSVACENGAF